MATARFEIQAYLRRNSLHYLNIGANANRPKGWLNVDVYPTFGVVYLDATRMSRLPSASFDAVLCEHMIEHVSHLDGFEICKQIHRVLKPNAVVRLVTPDLDRLARLVLQPSADDERYLDLMRKWKDNPLREWGDDPRVTPVDAINVAFRYYGHQYLYNRTALRNMLVEAGFSNIRETPASGHGHPAFRDAQAISLGEEYNNLDAFALEAER